MDIESEPDIPSSKAPEVSRRCSTLCTAASIVSIVFGYLTASVIGYFGLVEKLFGDIAYVFVLFIQAPIFLLSAHRLVGKFVLNRHITTIKFESIFRRYFIASSGATFVATIGILLIVSFTPLQIDPSLWWGNVKTIPELVGREIIGFLFWTIIAATWYGISHGMILGISAAAWFKFLLSMYSRRNAEYLNS